MLMLFTVCAPLLTMVAFMQVQKHFIRKEVKHQLMEGISRDRLVLLKFTKKEAKSELEWEHSREFEYRGEMYDVVETETHNDSVFYWCWWDHKETALNSELSKMVAIALGHNSQRQENKEDVVHFYQKLFFEEPQEIDLGLLAYQKYWPKPDHDWHGIHPAPANPPPKG